jgi:hypothetical protein
MKYSYTYFLNPEVNWLLIASNELKNSFEQKKPIISIQFHSLFGVCVKTIQYIHFIYLLNSPYLQPKYILWIMSYMKSYENLSIAPLKFKGVSARTFYDKVWKLIFYLSSKINEVIIFYLFLFFIL